MKTISLLQPWASLIAVGAKTLETRSWQTSYHGPLAIHASKKPWNWLELDSPGVWVMCDALVAGGYPFVRDRRPDHFGLPLGAIVATCTLVDCLPTNGLELQDMLTEDQGYFGDFRDGRYAWVLEDIRRLPEPIPAKGALSLWDWVPPADVGVADRRDATTSDRHD